MKTSFFCKLDIVLMCATKKSYFFSRVSGRYYDLKIPSSPLWKFSWYCSSVAQCNIIYIEVYLWVCHPSSQEWTGYAKSMQLLKLKWNQLIFSLWHHRSHLPWSWNKIPDKATYRQKSVFWLIVHGTNHIAGKFWQLEFEGISLIACTVRKKRVRHARVQLASDFY